MYFIMYIWQQTSFIYWIQHCINNKTNKNNKSNQFNSTSSSIDQLFIRFNKNQFLATQLLVVQKIQLAYLNSFVRVDRAVDGQILWSENF